MTKSIQNKLKEKKPRVYIEYEVGDVSEETVQQLAKAQLLYSFFGLAFGVFVMVLGCILLYLGISGESNFIADTFGIKAELTDAAPGTVLIVVGLIVIVVTRFRLTIKKKGKTANKENEYGSK